MREISRHEYNLLMIVCNLQKLWTTRGRGLGLGAGGLEMDLDLDMEVDVKLVVGVRVLES